MVGFSLASNTETYSERDFTTLLIDLYRDCPELWNAKNKHYFNRNKRSAGFKKIVEVLKVFKPDYTINKLKQKINTLRTNFNREHRAIEKKRLSRKSADDIPEPSLWYYNDFFFIKSQTEIAPTETSELLLAENSQSPASKLDFSSKKRKDQPDSTEQLVGLVTEYFKRHETEEDIIAKSWAMKLKKLRPDQRRFAEKIINDTLFEGEMGTLSRGEVNFVTHPHWSSSPPSSLSIKEENEDDTSEDRDENTF